MKKCGVCNKSLREKDIYAYYPEDSTYICIYCFGKEKMQKREEKKGKKCVAY